MAFVQADLKQGKSKKQSQEMRKLRNANKKAKTSTVSSTTTKYGNRASHRKNPHQMNDKTRKIFNEAKDSYAIPQAVQGFYSGIVSAFTGANLPVSKKAKDSTAYKIANIGGQMYGYGVGYGGVGKLTGKAAAKVVGTKAGKKAVTKIAGKKVFQSAAKKSLTKAGQNATKKAVEHTSRKMAKGVAKGLVKGAVADATVGTVMDSNTARAQGYKVGSDEWKKFMATSAALNIGVGGTVEIVPTAIKALSKGGSKKTVQRVINGKVKKVKVEKTYKDFSVENAARKKAEIIKESKKTLDDAKRKYDVAKKNNINVEEAGKVYRKAQSDYTKVIKDSTVKGPKAETPKYNVKGKTSLNQIKEAVVKGNRDRFMNQVSKVMKGEYNERLPLIVTDTPQILKRYGAKSNKITMASRNVRKIAYPTNYLGLKAGHNLGFKALEALPEQLSNPIAVLDSFTQPNSRVIVTNLIDGSDRPVIVALHLNKNGSIDFADEVVSMYGRNEYEAFIQRARAEGKVLYENKKIGLDNVRTSGLQLPGDAASSDPMFSIYKNTREVNSDKNLPPKSAANVGPEPIATDVGKGLDDIVQESKQNVNGHKDLGADTYKLSTKKSNAKNYGVDRGVVNATPYGETSQTAKTIYNSDLIDTTTKRRLTQEINDGLYTKYTKTNKTSVDNAVRRIGKDGIDAARQKFDSVAMAGNAKSEDVALGYKLAESYQKTGDYDNVMKVLSDVANMESEAGRTLQAMRLFTSFSPEGRKMAVRKNIAKMTDDMGVDIDVPNGLIEQLGKATDEKTINRLKKQIFKEIWDQIPASWTQKANAWRYMCMLANPKTHVRNILGNAIFVPVKGMRNIVASRLEKMLIREGDRSKAILTPKDKDLLKMGKEDFANIKDAIMGNSRYIEGQRDLDAKIFKNRSLEWARKKSGDLLEKEDEVFMGMAYKRSYAQYLKANGVKSGDEISEELLARARTYATNEALNSTYRDASALADFFASGKKYANMPLKQVPGNTTGSKVIKKAGSMALDATVPFTKTPINIMRRGWDYSPGGLIQGMGKILRSGGDNLKLIDGIAKVSSGLTGTGIMVLGAYMGMHNMAQGSLDTTTAEGKYKQMMGEQEYSIRIGDYTYTFDWAAPMSMPFFVGAELGNELEKNGFSFDAVLGAMKGITDPIFNLSMLSGLNTALDTAFDDNPTLGVVGNVAESYIGQYVPTLAGQIARTITPEKRTSTSTAENTDARSRERFLNQLMNKIPGLNNYNEPYVDLWGQTEKKRDGRDYALAALQNFLSPGTLKSTKKSFVDQEIFDLGDELGDMSEIVPRATTSNEFDKKFKGENYHMTEKDLTAYKKAKGQYAKEGLYDLFDTKKYRNMSIDEKRKAIKKVYDEAKDKATQEFLAVHDISKEEYKVEQMGKNQRKAYKKSGMDIDDFEQLYKAKGNVTSSDGSVTKAMKLISGGAENVNQVNSIYGDISDRAYHNARNLYNLGIKPKEVTKIAKKADTDGNKHFTTAELVSYLNNTNYSQYEKRYIFAALANWNAHNPY